MLVLTRNHGESIIINGNIEVTILGVQGGNVRLGIDAPKEVAIMREELYNKGITRVNGEFRGGEDR